MVFQSTIFQKFIVAVTGILLAGFLFAHMTGNLLFFLGKEAINTYAEFLAHSLHGTGIWLARFALLSAFILHIFFTIQLTVKNKLSRDIAYVKKSTIQASLSSRIMIISGVTILLFVIYHLMHFTLHTFEEPLYYTNPNGKMEKDVFTMMVSGFSSIPISLFYIISVSFLCSHLSHGVSSIFQTLGIRNSINKKMIEMFSWAYTLSIWIGFISIPISVLIFDYGK